MKTKTGLDRRILILQCLGMIMVLAGHFGDPILLLSFWFPYYSFHMPLFVFISGYLYKADYEHDVKKYIWKKMKRSILPFYGWLILYGMMTNVILKYGWASYGQRMSIENFFLYPWTYGCKYLFTAAWWFVPTLFLCQMINIIFRKMCGISRYPYLEYIYGIVLLGMGMATVAFSRRSDGMYGGSMDQLQMVFAKVGFLLPFFQLGHLAKKHVDHVDKIKPYVFYPLIMGMQIIAIWLSRDNGGISYSVVHLEFPQEPIITYWVAVNGISIWFRICKDILPLFAGNRIISCIGQNTWTVLLHHQMVAFFIQWGSLKIGKIVPLFGGLNEDQLTTVNWYTYAPGEIVQFRVVYIIAGIMIPLFIKFLLERGKEQLLFQRQVRGDDPKDRKDDG